MAAPGKSLLSADRRRFHKLVRLCSLWVSPGFGLPGRFIGLVNDRPALAPSSPAPQALRSPAMGPTSFPFILLLPLLLAAPGAAHAWARLRAWYLIPLVCKILQNGTWYMGRWCPFPLALITKS